MTGFGGLMRAAALVALMAVSAPAGATPFEDAEAAIERRDFATAFRLFEGLAVQGDVASQYNVALALANAIGVERDDVKAVEWLRKAAAADYAAAELMLGVMLKYGRGAPVDRRTAAALFERAALHGNPAAQFSLGIAYQEGHGVEKDQKRANELFRKAALQGYANAQIALAAAVTDGAGAEHDLKQAYMWLTLAAKGMEKGRARDLTYGLRDEVAKKMSDAERDAAAAEAMKFAARPDPDAIPEGKLAPSPAEVAREGADKPSAK